jgi:serine protease Do
MRIQLAIGTAILAAGMAPAADAQVVAPRARAAQVVRTERAWLGIGVKEIDSDSAKRLNLKEVRGVEITQVESDSPAAKAGIKDGDVVLEYNGQPVEGGEQLSRLVRETPIGRTVKLGVWRGGSMQTVTATIEASKGPQVFTFSGSAPMAMPEIHIPDMRNFQFGDLLTSQNPRIGIVGEPLANQEQLADFFGVKEGVLVKSVTRNSAAEKAGVKAGDVILKVDESRVNASGDITRAIRGKKSVNLTVVRSKKEMTITVPIEQPAGMGNPVRAYSRFPVMV